MIDMKFEPGKVLATCTHPLLPDDIEVRLTCCYRDGQPAFDVRQFKRHQDGSWTRTDVGVVLSMEEAPVAAAAVKDLLDAQKESFEEQKNGNSH